MKKFLISLSLITSFCFANGTLNVYSSRHYKEVDQKIFEEFTKETGIKINEINNQDAKALIKRIKDEGSSTDADVFLTVGIGSLYTAKKEGILKEIKDKKVLKNIPETFRDHQNNWIGLSYRARIFAYNPEKINKNELSTYLDLANPKWQGKVLTRSSSSEYNQNLIAFMIAKYGEKKTLEWAKSFANNLARSPKGNDRDQAVAVVQGQGDLAIINTYYMGKMIGDKDPLKREAASKLKIFFPDQSNGGTHINISGAGIVKHTKNYDLAIKFIEFLSSPKAQQMIADYNFEYPCNPNATINPVVKSWGTFKASKIPFDKIGENLEKATRIAGEANWK